MEMLAAIPHYGFWFLVLLTVLVFVHEYGHYIVARWCGVRVEVFSIGFGPELIGRNDKHGTRWKISAIPLGGYVKMFGQGANLLEGEAGKAMSAEDRKVAFDYKNVWRRMAIVAAGPIANYLFAALIFTVIFAVHGKDVSPPVVSAVRAESAAAAAGLQPGDRIVTLNGSAIRDFKEILEFAQLNLDQEIAVGIERNGVHQTVRLTPDVATEKDALGNDAQVGVLGIEYPAPVVGGVREDSAAAAAGLRPGDRIVTLNGNPISDFQQLTEFVRLNLDREIAIGIERNGVQEIVRATPRVTTVKDARGAEKRIGLLGIEAATQSERIELGLVDSVVDGVNRVFDVSGMMLKGLWQMVTGVRPASDIGGVIRIGYLSGEIANIGIWSLISFAALLSVNLGLVNLFPVPLLDGGHLTYYAIEAARGKPLGERTQEWGFRIGIAFVLGLMLFATWNDLVFLDVIGKLRALFT
ncbi:MAG: RIP metalloprotease RseP [Rhodospirillaceae bacterium]|nr:RIP metalloprotease RseP [Rhodospirillaceae bacterium]